MKKIVFQISFLMFLGLLIIAVQKNEKVVKTSNLKLTQLAGKQLFELKDCAGCHIGEGEEVIPIKVKRDDEWFKEHVTTESEIVIGEAKSERRKRKHLKKELSALNAFLFNTSDSQKSAIDSLPGNIAGGAYLAYQNNCSGCHVIAGEGEARAPELTFVGDKHTEKSWHVENLKNPQQFSAESNMPAFEDKLPESSLQKLADYLLTLRK